METTLEDYKRVIDINQVGTFLGIRTVVEPMKAAGGGSIINVSSIDGLQAKNALIAYAASKWAVVGFTKSLAKELGPHGIRVNAILPGQVRGPRLRKVLEDRARAKGLSYDQMEARSVENVALRRMVSEEDIAGTVLFLCSTAGSSISAQSVSVCGGIDGI